jgi:hypothetical protein
MKIIRMIAIMSILTNLLNIDVNAMMAQVGEAESDSVVNSLKEITSPNPAIGGFWPDVYRNGTPDQLEEALQNPHFRNMYPYVYLHKVYKHYLEYPLIGGHMAPNIIQKLDLLRRYDLGPNDQCFFRDSDESGQIVNGGGVVRRLCVYGVFVNSALDGEPDLMLAKLWALGARPQKVIPFTTIHKPGVTVTYPDGVLPLSEPFIARLRTIEEMSHNPLFYTRSPE